MRIRIRAPNGTHTITVEDVATVGDLLKEVRSKTSINGGLELRIGFPPKPLELPSSDTLLIDLPISVNNEQLIVSESASGSSSQDGAGPSSGPISNSHGSSFQAEERESPFSLNRLQSDVKNFFTGGPYEPPRSPQNKPKSDMDAMMTEAPIISVKNHPGESLVLRIMEDDNSCLFRAVNYAYARGIDMMYQLRELVAEAIQNDTKKPEFEQRYNAAILGMPIEQYCEKITSPNTWGGAIELQILAEHFEMEIWSVDVSTGRIDKFNEGKPSCGIVVYSGIHYDCLAMTFTPYDSDNDVTVFDTSDAGVLDATLKLVDVLKDRHYFTDTSKFAIKCNICQKGLKGEKQAIKHAEQTGHADFGEY